MELNTQDNKHIHEYISDDTLYIQSLGSLHNTHKHYNSCLRSAHNEDKLLPYSSKPLSNTPSPIYKTEDEKQDITAIQQLEKAQ